MDNFQELIKLETSLRLVGAQGREKLKVGPFEAFISASKNPTLSFATPYTDVSDWSTAVYALTDVFAERGRSVRLEYIHELHPSLAAALEAAGFEQDSAAPVMTLTQDALAGPPPETHGTYRGLQADEPERLREFLERQNVAYGGVGGADDEGALAWLPQLIGGLKSGVVMAAGLEQNRTFVSGAMIQVGGKVGELAGVWTSPNLQGQGLAFTLCQRLLTDHFTAGFELCWLSAAAGAEQLYQRLGFKRVGTQLNYHKAKPET